ncbi:GGDEF domain-containing protein [Paenibacillus hexagrammi]|uniref:GGDEF domain-containing protein n=1 Tax=Paenibacillus hexagrammi TaxID=2908839 RepID=A0ABY3SF89_9BACL|nr:GGDEF domain-containing protein [Paenibacillus sp. YPD9-1]UJF31821.1 GGDEF domain-containing protein [Paenibacillus sp. YPD9-1]
MVKRLSESISMKIFITFFLTFLVIISALGLLTYQIAKQNIVNKVKVNSEQAVEQTVKRMDLKLEALKNMTFLFTDDQKLQEDIVTDSAQENDGTFESLQAANRIKIKLSSLLTTSSAIHSAQLLPYDRSKNEEWYQNIVKGEGKAIWLPTRNNRFVTDISENTFGLGRLIKNNLKNKPIRVLLFELKGSFLQDEMKGLETSDHNRLYMIDSMGRIMETTTTSDKIGDAASWWKNSPLSREAGSSSFQLKIGSKEYLFIHYTSAETGWTLVNQIPIQQLVSEASNIWRITAIMVMISILLSIGIGALIARRVGRPLSELSELMKRSEDGDLEVRADIRYKDEIGHVGRSFNNMIVRLNEFIQLKAHTAQLEVQISLESKHRQDAQSLSIATMSLSSTLEMDDLLKVALRNLYKLVTFETAEIYSFQEGTAYLAMGAFPNALGDFTFEEGMTNKQFNYIFTSDHEQRWISIDDGAATGKRTFVMPIHTSNKEKIFCFSVVHEELPSESALENIFAYFNQVSVVMENVNQYHEMLVLATTDGLTGVSNRRHFMRLAENEMKKARNEHSNLSLILYDIDFFKKFNDQYGHLAGDEVLKMISNRVSKNLRDGDIMGRYGGEEFIILLPHTSLAAALQVAESLRAAVECECVLFNDTSLRVTASFGVAEVGKGEHLLEVINQADTALYEAKARGRNCVASSLDIRSA